MTWGVPRVVILRPCLYDTLMPFEPFTTTSHQQLQDLTAHKTAQINAGFQAHPEFQSGQQHYFPPDAPYQAARKLWWMHILIIGAIATKAGHNHYKVTGDWGQALQAGAGAFVRWLSWSTLWFVWAILLMWFATPTEASGYVTSDILGMAACVVVWPFLFGVTWCRNIDYSLFRRGLVYKLYQPIAVAVEGIASPLLYALIGVPMAVVWGSL